MAIAHMQEVPVNEAVAAIEAVDTVERRVFDEETNETTTVAVTVEDAVAAAEVAQRRNWVKVSRLVYHLRLEVDGEVFTLTSVHPLP